MKSFIINRNITIKECLIKIDFNCKNYLFMSEGNQIVGVVTEGDIRREIINGKSVNETIEFKKDFTYLEENDSFSKICNLFKSERVHFLPILNTGKNLINIITKKQFHSLLLHDQTWDLKQNLINADENEIDFEIYDRPWGFYKSTLLSNFVQSKVITVFPNSEISLQEHKRREEHWVIIKGKGTVILGESYINVYPGKYIFIPKGCKHQIINDSGENIVFSEVQLGDYFGEDDIIRYSDKYGRK
jgi:mannose-1-phosphate guanylyltransferase / mannose-6-phosphate isomerase